MSTPRSVPVAAVAITTVAVAAITTVAAAAVAAAGALRSTSFFSRRRGRAMSSCNDVYDGWWAAGARAQFEEKQYQGRHTDLHNDHAKAALILYWAQSLSVGGGDQVLR
jgi:hypothetical protein